MSTTKQKTAARKNLRKARAAQHDRARGKKVRPPKGLTTAEQNDLRKDQFAFPDQRKEPLVDAKHVRNAIARFDQVENVSKSDRDKAWRRIRKAAKRFDIEIEAKDWRDLAKNGKVKKR
jgi:hypothetical protein